MRLPRSLPLLVILALLSKPALSQLPVFTTQTPISGNSGNSFFVFLPVSNIGGGTATNMKLTSVALTHVGISAAEATQPANLPSLVGSGLLAPTGVIKLNLEFDNSHLSAGTTYLVTVRGTYQVGNNTYGFALNRPIPFTKGFAASHQEVLDAIAAKFDNVPGLDQSADNQTLLQFVSGLPQISNAGVGVTSSLVWAQFADTGRKLVIYNNRPTDAQLAALRTAASTLSSPPNVMSSITTSDPMVITSRTASALLLIQTNHRLGKWHQLRWRAKRSGPGLFYTECCAVDPRLSLRWSSFRRDSGHQGFRQSWRADPISAIGRAAREAAKERKILLFSECERQLSVQIAPPPQGYGLDGMWNDDLHHSAIVRLTGKREAYYTDHLGRAQEFVSAAKYGFLYQGQFYSWQRACRGTSFLHIEPLHMISFLENHDQVANLSRRNPSSRELLSAKIPRHGSLLAAHRWNSYVFYGAGVWLGSAFSLLF